VRVWIDMTASAHVLVFRPLIEVLEQAGNTVEITARDYAQTLQLLELHGLEAEVIEPGKRVRWRGASVHYAPGPRAATSTSRSRTARTS